LTALAVLTGTLAPSSAWAHSRHHRHHAQIASKSPSPSQRSPIAVAGGYAHKAAISLARTVNDTRDSIDLSQPEGKVAGTYAHTAALKLASVVNKARNTVDRRRMSRHEIRLLEHQERLAQREANHHERVMRVAMQDQDLHSGDVVRAAYSFRGTRYVMGGTSRSGFDCSGFTRYILSCTDGVDLPRTASEQFYHGTPVSRDEMKPGDLVFFKNTYKHGISHVGIYTGNGKFVHAANSHKGVREDSLDETYYAHHFAGARRVLGMR
jgi:cell wall-associated NlpC family hydrolase